MVVSNYDVVIIGGGLVGGACAVDLLQHNPRLKVLLLDRHKPDFLNQDKLDSKIYAISPRNMRHLHDLGVLPDYRRVGQIDSMIVHGNRNSRISFDAADSTNGYLAQMVEYKNLHAALYHKMTNYENLVFLYGQADEVTSDENLAWITINGAKVSTSLLIAADGGNSFVRQKLGIATKQIDYNQSGVVANFKCEKPHNNTAYQWFLDGGILALLPLPDQQLSIVWSTNQPDLLTQASDAELCDMVATASNNILGKLSLLTKAQSFPLRLNLIERCFHNRVVLIGDAFHTIHPLAGQGVNLGFGDSWELNRLITRLGIQQMTVSDLARFNYFRLLEVRKMQMTCHSLQRLFDNCNPTIDFLRNAGLNLVNSIQPLKKLLIDSAINY